MPVDSSSLVLFDFQTQQWSELAKVPGGWPAWSRDGQSVYFLNSTPHRTVLQVRVSDRKVKRVFDLGGLQTTGRLGDWLGLAADDSPLLLRDIGSQDVYSLDWEEP